MNMIKWLTGGNDRISDAQLYVKELIEEISDQDRQKNLLNTLKKFSVELERRNISQSFELSRLNIDLSNAVIKDNCELTNKQEVLIEKISKLCDVRFGY